MFASVKNHILKFEATTGSSGGWNVLAGSTGSRVVEEHPAWTARDLEISEWQPAELGQAATTPSSPSTCNSPAPSVVIRVTMPGSVAVASTVTANGTTGACRTGGYGRRRAQCHRKSAATRFIGPGDGPWKAVPSQRAAECEETTCAALHTTGISAQKRSTAAQRCCSDSDSHTTAAIQFGLALPELTDAQLREASTTTSSATQ